MVKSVFESRPSASKGLVGLLLRLCLRVLQDAWSMGVEFLGGGKLGMGMGGTHDQAPEVSSRC